MAPAQFPRKGEQGKARRAVYRVMKTKALLTALFVAGLVASFAVAAPAEKGKGKGGAAASSTGTTTTTSPGKGKGKGNRACKPRRAVVLRGPFTASGTDGDIEQRLHVTTTSKNRLPDSRSGWGRNGKERDGVPKKEPGAGRGALE